MKNSLTESILHELRSPQNFVEVEWNHPESIPAEERERITNEAEEYRFLANGEEVEEYSEMYAGLSPLEAASLFLDLAADHGVYNTMTISLKRKL